MAEILTRTDNNGNIPRDAIKTNAYPRDSVHISNIDASVTRLWLLRRAAGNVKAFQRRRIKGRRQTLGMPARQ
jgi:hypothetical protein